LRTMTGRGGKTSVKGTQFLVHEKGKKRVRGRTSKRPITMWGRERRRKSLLKNHVQEKGPRIPPWRGGREVEYGMG